MSHLQRARFHASNSEGAVTKRERNILPALHRGLEWGFQDEALPAPALWIDKGPERLFETRRAHRRILLLIRRKCHWQCRHIGFPAQRQLPDRIVQSFLDLA